MGMAPITEEDKPAIESMIKKLSRYRKRDHSSGSKWLTELDDAIESLQKYGAIKRWWDFPND